METILGISVIKSEGVDGNTFDILPRRGQHNPIDVNTVIAHIRENYGYVDHIEVTWLPKIPGPPVDHNALPHILFRTQLITGYIAPKKRVVWGFMSFEKYSVSVGLYDGKPETSNLLPEARVSFTDGEYAYSLTGEELSFILSSDKTIQRKKLK